MSIFIIFYISLNLTIILDIVLPVYVFVISSKYKHLFLWIHYFCENTYFCEHWPANENGRSPRQDDDDEFDL